MGHGIDTGISGPARAKLMRLPRVRFTVRWLMVAVAVVAVVLGGVLFVERERRRRYYREEAVACRGAEINATLQATFFEKRASKSGSHPINKRMAGWHRQLAAHLRREWERSELAASRAWPAPSPDDLPPIPRPAS